MKNLSWYFKQLFPLKYDTTYRIDGQWYIAIWRMWFGRCFYERHYKLVDDQWVSKMPIGGFDPFVLR